MSKEIKELDLMIIGGGPAGLTSAIYASRAKLEMILLEDNILGGQVKNSYTIENYPGFKEVSGAELGDLMCEQAEACGAVIDEFDQINRIIKFTDDEKIIETDDYIYKPKAVIIAVGASPKKLPIEHEAQYLGKGIHYCAVCDGAMYEDKVVAVVGGGNSALEEALFLTKFAKKVIMIRRKESFNGEKHVIDKVMSNEKIEVLFNEDLVDVRGGQFVETAIIRNTKTLEEREIALEAVFGFIGTEPKVELFKEFVELDSQGYIITDEDMNTNIKGVFAAGDVRRKKYRQIATAIGDGTIAALAAEKYIIEKRGEN